MSIGVLYSSHSTDRGQAEFDSMPFYSANITHNRDKASSMSFKSHIKLEEADRIIYKDLQNNTTFGGQVVKRNKTLGGDYSYEVIDYKRLYQSKVSCSFSNSTSSTILKKLLKSDLNNLSTSGIQNTNYIHSYLKWDNVSLWTIVEQLAWLEYKAGNYIYYDVDYTGALIFKQIPQTVQGYKFSEAYNYEESYDSSSIITQGILINSNDPSERLNAFAKDSVIAKWGYVSDMVTCTPPKSNSPSSSSTNCSGTTTNKFWSKCGLSPDKKLIIGIGKPSAPGENKYSYSLHKTVFVNNCPHCGKPTLVWGYQWGSGTVPCKGTHEGGSNEGHFFCTNCDADYGVINGREHINGSKYALKTVVNPVKSSQSEANLLKKGKLQYTQGNNSSNCTKSTSLKNDANIKKYNIPSSIVKQTLAVTSTKNNELQNAKAVFNFIKNNTVYESYKNTRYGAEGTLKKKKGNCVDHAHLMCAMLRSIGIKCNYIHNPCICHVYNKVYINSKGVIVDTGRGNPSWGSHWGGSGCPTEKTSLNF